MWAAREEAARGDARKEPPGDWFEESADPTETEGTSQMSRVSRCLSFYTLP